MEKHFVVPLFFIFSFFLVEKCIASVAKSASTFLISQEREFVCPENDGFFAVPGECSSSYYACVGGTAIPQECPNVGDVFDPVLKRCVPYGIASCNNGQTTSSTISTSSSSTVSTTSSSTISTTSSSTSTTLSTTTATTTTTTTAPFVCPEPDGFFPLSPTTCSANYYICVGDIATPAACPGNTIFDPQQLKCVAPEDSICSQYFTCPTPEGFFPIPNTCGSDFYVCVSGSPYISTCPNGNIFDPVTLVCTPPNSATCAGTFKCPAKDGFFPIPDACSSYYYTCVDFEHYITNCPDGGIFDPILFTCVAQGTESCSTV